MLRMAHMVKHLIVEMRDCPEAPNQAGLDALAERLTTAPWPPGAFLDDLWLSEDLIKHADHHCDPSCPQFSVLIEFREDILASIRLAKERALRRVADHRADAAA